MTVDFYYNSSNRRYAFLIMYSPFKEVLHPEFPLAQSYFYQYLVCCALPTELRRVTIILKELFYSKQSNWDGFEPSGATHCKLVWINCFRVSTYYYPRPTYLTNSTTKLDCILSKNFRITNITKIFETSKFISTFLKYFL